MKKRTITLLGAVLAISAALSGCGKAEVQPVAIQAGVDKCDVCNMLVPDDHNATEIILKDGKALKFDDIGDMYVWTKKNGRDQVQAQFVRDYYTKEWLKLENSSFAYDKSFKTPMAYGVYSFKDMNEAQKFINEQGHGKLLSFKDLESHTWERNMDMMKEMKKQHMEQQQGQKQQSMGEM